MNDNFSNDNFSTEQLIAAVDDTLNDINDIDEIMNKILEALRAIDATDQPEPLPTPEQPHHDQPDANGDVLRDQAILSFHDGVYYWEPWYDDLTSNQATD